MDDSFTTPIDVNTKLKELSLMFVCSIRLLPQIPASPLLPPIVNMRNEKFGLTNREYGKLSIDRSRH